MYGGGRKEGPPRTVCPLSCMGASSPSCLDPHLHACHLPDGEHPVQGRVGYSERARCPPPEWWEGREKRRGGGPFSLLHMLLPQPAVLCATA